jgi:hypothetical protein
MRRKALVIAVATCFPALAVDCLKVVQKPQDIASPLFPAPAIDMQFLAREIHLPKAKRTLREHAWKLLSLVTQPVHPACYQPIFESWENRAAAFSSDNNLSNKNAGRPTFRVLEVTPKLRAQTSSPAAGRTFSTAYFNPSTVKTLKGSAGNLLSAKYLNQLRAQLPQSQGSVQFERTSVVVKPVWRVISRDPGSLCLPVWDSEQEVRGGGGVPESAWKRNVVVTHPLAQKPKHLPADCGSPGKPVFVPAQRFYGALLTESDTVDGGGAFKAGDAIILLGLHIITKEMPDWIWMTFWWHPEPGHSIFGSGTRPVGLREPWLNYRMDVTISEEMESDPFVKGERIIFNPYLEAGLPPTHPAKPGGTASNCISCHSRAVWPGRKRPLNPGHIFRGHVNPDFFRERLKLDFLWSMVLSKRT